MTDGEKIDLFLAISFANVAAACVNIFVLIALRAADIHLLAIFTLPAALAIVLAVDAAVWISSFLRVRRAISG